MKPYVYILRSIAEQIGLRPVQHLAIEPGVQAAFRVTIYYADRRAVSAVTTVVQSSAPVARCEVVYQGRFDNKPLTRNLDVSQVAMFAKTLRQVGFDSLPDQDTIPLYNADLCLVERGANSFTHGVIFSPQVLEGYYTHLYAAVSEFLPESLREIK